MNLRHFTLTNALGEILNITDTESYFFYQIDGLGVTRSQTFRARGESRWTLTHEEQDQGVIGGTMYMANPSLYAQFVAFCSEAPLIMSCNYFGTTYYCECVCQSIEKSEDANPRLNRFPVKFPMLTNWYRRIAVVTEATEASGGWVWPVEWPVTWASTEGNKVVINSDTKISSPCKLTIFGALTSPTWSHYVNGVLYESGAFTDTVTIPEGGRLEIDNTGDNTKARILNADGELVQDVYELRDFGTAFFIHLQKGQNDIVISSTDAASVTVKAEAFLHYATV